MPTPTQIIHRHTPSLTPYESLYKHLHANPELSFCEHETLRTISSWLSEHTSFTVKAPIGETGLVAILENGRGPVVMLRADTDALPIEEQTGLEYASKKRMMGKDGVEHPVMHACGHDMHISALLATAVLLQNAKAEWSGTVILIFQPAEEKAGGAQAMVNDGLYTKHSVPKPDIVLGSHVVPLPAGSLGATAPHMASSADSLAITIHGRGGHASQPHRSIDPVATAAYVTTRLQTLVARETDPLDAAVVSVTSIRAGDAENVIPEDARLKVNVRAWKQETRAKVLNGIRRVVRAECNASGMEKEPEFEVLSAFPNLDNGVDETARVAGAMRVHFADDKWDATQRLAGSEDFGILATSIGVPSVYWVYGGVDPQEWERRAGDVPGNHSHFFAPVIQPTLRVAVEGYAVGALAWLGK